MTCSNCNFLRGNPVLYIDTETLLTISIISDTDYTILEKLGVPGLDIAFYNPRSHYHTPRDTLEYTTPEAVQHMGQMVLAAVRAVDQADGILSKEHERKMVNFDILGRIMFANGFPAVNTVNILSLVFVPLIAAVWTFFTSEKNLKTVACRAGLVLYGLTTTSVAFILSALFVIAAAAIMIKINPKVIPIRPLPISLRD